MSSVVPSPLAPPVLTLTKEEAVTPSYCGLERSKTFLPIMSEAGFVAAVRVPWKFFCAVADGAEATQALALAEPSLPVV